MDGARMPSVIDVAPELSVHRLARIDPPAQTGAEAD